MSFVLLGILNSQAAGAGGGASGVAGYVAGGSGSSVVDKFSFPDETRTTLATGLSVARPGVGMSNPSVAGYVFLTSSDGTDKFSFPSDTRTVLAASRSVNAIDTGFFDSNVAGYVSGGDQGGGNVVSHVDKLSYSAETYSRLATGLSAARSLMAGMSNPSVAGYVAGGFESPSPFDPVDTVDKFAFPSDSRSTLGTGLSLAREALAGFSNFGVAGYAAGGGSLPGRTNSAVVDKFAFSSDTRSTLGTGLNTARARLTGMSDSAVAGYAAGGFDLSTSTSLDVVEKFDFPSDTRSTLGTGLSVARSFLTGFQDA